MRNYQLDIVMGRHKLPKSVSILFEAEFVIEIAECDFGKAKELVEKLGESLFDDASDRDIQMYPHKSLTEAIKWIEEETDLLIEHDSSYWDGRNHE